MSSTRRSTYARARTKSNINPSNPESQSQSQSQPHPPPQQQQHSQHRPFASSSASAMLAPTSNTTPTKQDPMTPSSRYLHNLRVIQRHDPTITSLFDQFPHVCVYHHKGDEWQKKGCEGAMFLFEREEEPKYGFYILNRNNTGDYIQRLTPDDDIELANAYLIYRAYGKVTSDTIGLWTMVTHDREAMSQVMMRLHSYVRRGERYPDVYRRKPETWSTTPAPAHVQAQFVPQPQIHPTQTQTQAQTLPQTPTHLYSEPHLQFPLQSSPYLLHSPAHQHQRQQPPPPPPPNHSSSGPAQAQPDLPSSLSTFTNLIAKLDYSHAQSAAQSTAPAPVLPSTSSPFLQTSAAPHPHLGIAPGTRLNNVHLKAPDRTISASVPPSKSITGIPLLDSIFASASGSGSGSAGASTTATTTASPMKSPRHHHQQSHQQPGLSPFPTSTSTSGLQQQTRMNVNTNTNGLSVAGLGLGRSPASSSGVTPTQPVSELPSRSFSPSRKHPPPATAPHSHQPPFLSSPLLSSPLAVTNGVRPGPGSGGLNTSMRGVLPFPSTNEHSSPRGGGTASSRRYGRESAPPGNGKVNTLSSSYFLNGGGSGAVHSGVPPRRHNSAQYSHMSIPEAKEEEEKEGEEGGFMVPSQVVVPMMTSPNARLKIKKKEKKRESGKQQQQQQQQLSSLDVKHDGVEWALVDDRSLSVDGEEDGEEEGREEVEEEEEESGEGEVSGLGDGFMDALATLSESDAYLSGVGAKDKAKGKTGANANTSPNARGKGKGNVNGGRGLISVNGSRNGASGSRDATNANTNAIVGGVLISSLLSPPRSGNGVNGSNGRGGRRKRKAKERGEGVDTGLASTITNGTISSNGTTAISTTTVVTADDTNGLTPLHNQHQHNHNHLNLNTNVPSTSYSSPSSSSGFPAPTPGPGFSSAPVPSEIARAPSSSSASSRSFQSFQQQHKSRFHSSTAASSSSSSAEVRTALMQTYGNRSRVVGDKDSGAATTTLLGEEDLKAEIVNLINNDPTFMKELYQTYLSKVKV